MPKQLAVSPEPHQIIRSHVPAHEVARYYLKAEFGQLFGNDVAHTRLAPVIDEWQDAMLWRVLEAMSSTYRLNSVFWTVTDARYEWREELWDIASIGLTGMKPSINTVMKRPEVNHEPPQFGKFLQTYFKSHPNDDPLELNELRPGGQETAFPIILLRQQPDRGRPVMLDGSHRLLELVQQGKTQVQAYRAVPVHAAGYPMLGDASFKLLRALYADARNEAERGAIFETALLMAAHSSDGRTAIKTYWLDHTESEEVRAAAERMLGNLDKS